MTSADEAVIATRRAYEANATAWAGRYQGGEWHPERLDRFRAFLSDGGRVLDLGCGPGRDAEGHARRGLVPVGFDVTCAMLGLAGGVPALSGRLVQGDSRRLPFADACFEAVWASASLLHLPKAQVLSALDEVARILQPGGVFYSAMKEGAQDGLDSPDARGPVKAPRYFAHYRRSEWNALLTKSGFRIESQDIDSDDRPGYPDWIATFARKA